MKWGHYFLDRRYLTVLALYVLISRLSELKLLSAIFTCRETDCTEQIQDGGDPRFLFKMAVTN